MRILIILILTASLFSQSAYWRDEVLKSDHDIPPILGLAKDISGITKFGDAEGVNGTATIWKGSTVQPLYIFPADSGEYINILSDSLASDSGVLIKIFGLDYEGGTRDTVVTLTSDTLEIPGKWRAINRAFTYGADALVGRLRIFGRTSGNIFAYIVPADQQTAQMVYMVPKDKVVIMRRIASAINKATSSDAGAVIKFYIRLPNKIFRSRLRYGLQKMGTSTYTATPINLSALPPLTQIEIRVTTTAAADVAQIIEAGLYDTDVVPPWLIPALLEN